MLFSLLGGSQIAFAQQGEELISGVNNDWVLLAALSATFVTLLIVFIILVAVTFGLINQAMPKKVITPEEEKEPFWAWFWLKFNAAVPKGKEKDILLDHDYDGIHELDNDLPPWWKYGFYLSILSGVIYFFYYHGGTEEHTVSVREYLAETEQAEVQKQAYLAKMENLIDENSVEALTDIGDVAAGQKTYMANCLACHGKEGEGGVGPNLTDKYWIHGGSIQDIFKTIKYGVPEKGMLSWKEKLTPKQMQELSSFIMTLQGTTPADRKSVV